MIMKVSPVNEVVVASTAGGRGGVSVCVCVCVHSVECTVYSERTHHFLVVVRPFVTRESAQRAHILGLSPTVHVQLYGLVSMYCFELIVIFNEMF